MGRTAFTFVRDGDTETALLLLSNGAIVRNAEVVSEKRCATCFKLY